MGIGGVGWFQGMSLHGVPTLYDIAYVHVYPPQLRWEPYVSLHEFMKLGRVFAKRGLESLTVRHAWIKPFLSRKARRETPDKFKQYMYLIPGWVSNHSPVLLRLLVVERGLRGCLVPECIKISAEANDLYYYEPRPETDTYFRTHTCKCLASEASTCRVYFYFTLSPLVLPPLLFSTSYITCFHLSRPLTNRTPPVLQERVVCLQKCRR